MLDFAKTAIGRKFFDGQIPALIEALGSIAIAVARLAKATEGKTETTPGVIGGTWEEHPDMEGFFSLQPAPSIGGSLLHVEAIEVKQESDLQEAAHDHNQSALDGLYDLREPGKPLATIEIDGRPCVVYGCPSEQ